jgi:hypothetical protein
MLWISMRDIQYAAQSARNARSSLESHQYRDPEEQAVSTNSPLYHPMKPSVLSVFHRQSNGFEYRAPRMRPSGPVIVGSGGRLVGMKAHI